MKRRLIRLRMRLHDWMWDGGPLPSLPRYLARRLPLYFSDPEAHDLKRDWPVGTQVDLTFDFSRGFVVTEPTTTASAGSTVTYRWKP